MKIVDEHGRKYALALVAVVFFAIVPVSVYLKALVPALADLDLPVLTGAAAGVAGLVAAFAGANAWVHQSEARRFEAQVTLGTTDEP